MRIQDGGQAIQTTRGFNTIFIHSSLDDAGLTPQQFRVLAHLSRRAGDGLIWASVASMAEVCQIHPDTVRESLTELERRTIISREERPGRTTLFRILPPGSWNIEKPLETGKRGRRTSHPPETNTPPKQMDTHPPETNGGHPPETNGYEGYPCKGNPKEGNPPEKSPQLQKPQEASPSQAAASAAQEAYALWIGRYNEAHPEEPYFNGTAKRRKADESAMRALVASGRTPEQIGETARRMFAAAKQAVNGKRAWWSEHCKSAFNFCERWTEITGELGPAPGSTSGTSTAMPASDDKFLRRWTREQGPVREQFRDDSSFRAHSQAWQQWAEGKA